MSDNNQTLIFEHRLFAKLYEADSDSTYEFDTVTLRGSFGHDHDWRILHKNGKPTQFKHKEDLFDDVHEENIPFFMEAAVGRALESILAYER